MAQELKSCHLQLKYNCLLMAKKKIIAHLPFNQNFQPATLPIAIKSKTA